MDDYLKQHAGEKISKNDLLNYVKSNELKIEEVNKEGRSSPKEGITQFGGGTTKYSNYTLPGRENYREMLFTLPEKMGITPQESKEYLQLNRDYANLTPEQKNRLTELEKENVKNRPDSFKSSHWNEPNVLAHARVDDRTDAEGKKVLFAEELQSDWALEGRKKGYKNDADEKRFNEITDRLRQIEKENNVKSNDLDGLVKLQDTNKEYRDLGEEGKRINPNYNQGVPNMPFKSNWHEFVLKRLLREAAEKGYAKLAWTTGEQQAERYDLSKQVDNINYWKTEDGKGGFTAYKDGKIVHKEKDISQNEFEKYLGKDIAKKINEGAGADKETNSKFDGKIFYGDLTGENLKIGGGWAKNLYDKTIPEFLDKYGKKWGAKVGETKLNMRDPEYADYDEIHPTEWKDGWTLSGTKKAEDGEFILDTSLQYPSEKAANEAIKEIENNKTTVHSIDITPEMKKSVMEEGQPMFGKESNRIISDKAYEQAKKNIVIKGQNLTAGIDPTLLKDYARIGAYHVESGARNFIDWSKKMIDDFGEKIKPYLLDIWRQTKTDYSDLFKGEGNKEVTPEGKIIETGKKTSITPRMSIENKNEKIETPAKESKPVEPVKPNIEEKTSLKNKYSDAERKSLGLDKVETRVRGESA